MASTACMVEAWSNQVIEIHEMHVSQLCEPWKQALDAMKEIQVSQRAGCDAIFSSNQTDAWMSEKHLTLCHLSNKRQYCLLDRNWGFVHFFLASN